MPVIPDIIEKIKKIFHVDHEAFDHNKVLVIFVLGGPGAGEYPKVVAGNIDIDKCITCNRKGNAMRQVGL
jgi:hypothetical protein